MDMQLNWDKFNSLIVLTTFSSNICTILLRRRLACLLGALFVSSLTAHGLASVSNNNKHVNIKFTNNMEIMGEAAHQYETKTIKALAYATTNCHHHFVSRYYKRCRNVSFEKKKGRGNHEKLTYPIVQQSIAKQRFLVTKLPLIFFPP